MKKNLLIFGYTMEMGGAEKALVDTLNYLQDKCNIDLYLLETKGSLMDNIPKNVNIFRIKTNIIKYILFRFLPFFRKFIINKIARKKDYYAALAYMEGRCCTWVADINKKIKKFAWIHNDVSKFNIGIPEKEIIDSYLKMDTVICVSKQAKAIFCKKYHISSNKVDVIYNFINEKEILSKSKEFNVNNKTFTFVNVAKMRDQKRQDRLVYAAKYLKELGYDFQIQLIGDGPNLNKIKKLVYDLNVEDKVEVMGLKTNPYPYIKNADFFVLSSYMEGYGIVVKESILLHTKVLTTDIVGPREILEEGKYGIIVPNNDESIKYKMREILDNNINLIDIENNLKSYKGDNELIKSKTIKMLGL